VTKATTNKLARPANTQLIIERIVKGITRSTPPTSSETRFNIRPRGVVSKNCIGLCRKAVSKRQKSRHDARTPPSAIMYAHNISNTPANVHRNSFRSAGLTPLQCTGFKFSRVILLSLDDVENYTTRSLLLKDNHHPIFWHF